jgi:alpha-L-fucosidase 2
LNLFGGGSIDKKVEGAWICWHLYENYRFTHDKKFLEQVSFPIIRGAVNFWEDTLIETNGFLLAPNVQSSEWGPTENGVAYAQEIIWELFSEYIELSEVLGDSADKAHRIKVAMMRDKLAVPQIGSHGEVMEWYSEQTSSKMWGKEHRHISHLVGLFPGRQISPLTTPALAKAAVVSLEHRGDGGTGWAEIMRAGSWARLFEGDKALTMLEAVIKGHIWPNGLDSINYGASTGGADKFQIDANFGFPAVVNEMLLQSQSGVINLLPALPKKFPTGSVRGIRARDGFLIDLDWDKGQLTRAVIHSTLGERCQVRYGDKVVSLELKKDASVVLDKNLTVSR